MGGRWGWQRVPPRGASLQPALHVDVPRRLATGPVEGAEASQGCRQGTAGRGGWRGCPFRHCRGPRLAEALYLCPGVKRATAAPAQGWSREAHTSALSAVTGGGGREGAADLSVASAGGFRSSLPWLPIFLPREVGGHWGGTSQEGSPASWERFQWQIPWGCPCSPQIRALLATAAAAASAPVRAQRGHHSTCLRFFAGWCPKVLAAAAAPAPQGCRPEGAAAPGPPPAERTLAGSQRPAPGAAWKAPQVPCQRAPQASACAKEFGHEAPAAAYLARMAWPGRLPLTAPLALRAVAMEEVRWGTCVGRGV